VKKILFSILLLSVFLPTSQAQSIGSSSIGKPGYGSSTPAAPATFKPIPLLGRSITRRHTYHKHPQHPAHK
jgi:hypothetical protein